MSGTDSRFSRANIVFGVLGWAVALLMFLPVAWLVLRAFKTESEAFTVTPHLRFTPTLDSFKTALAQGGGYCTTPGTRCSRPWPRR